MKAPLFFLTAWMIGSYLLGYRSGTRREIREIRDSRVKDVYRYYVRKNH